jgi:DNA-binding response OmpR family regulator
MQAVKRKLLYVEDETDLGNVTRQYLELMDFSVDWCCSGAEAINLYQKNHADYNLVIIDIQLPDIDGFGVAVKIRERNPDVYFLFLTARKEKPDRVKGLTLGAVDYICKPFDIDELVLRIRNIIWHQIPQAQREKELASNILNIGDLCLNKDLLELSIPGQIPMSLTQREAELLEYLSKNRNVITKREEILVQIWGESDYFLGRSLDVFIVRLRKLLAVSSNVKINNVYGVGFIFSVAGMEKS